MGPSSRLQRLRSTCLTLGLAWAMFAASSPLLAGWVGKGPFEPGFVLAIDPQTPSKIYVGIRTQGVWRSQDGGATWSQLRANLDVNDLVIHPSQLNVLYGAVGFFGFAKSSQSGVGWQIFGPSEIGTSFAVDPQNPTVLYAASGDVSRSADGGATWSPINTGLGGGEISTLLVDPSQSATLFAASLGGLYRTTNTGGSWSKLTNGLPATWMQDLAFDPQTSQTIYVASLAGELFKSTNGGDAWSPAGTGLPVGVNLWSLAIHPTQPQILYVATSDGIYKTTNGGLSWARSSTGLGNTRADGSLDPGAMTVEIDPLTPSTLYAGGTRTLFKSVDNGQSWTALDTHWGNLIVDGLAVDPTHPQRVLASGRSLWTALGPLAFLSLDGGQTWPRTDAALTHFAWDPVNAGVVYGGGEGTTGVFKSLDGGVTWASSNTGLGARLVRTLAVDPATPSTVYAGTDVHGVFKSVDAGANWSASNTGLTQLDIKAIAIDPNTPTTLYVGTGAGAFVSTTGGATWSPINTGFPPTWFDVVDLAINPLNSLEIFAAVHGRVYRTINGGASWTATDAGIIDATCIELDPQTPTTLYAGSRSLGVFQSISSGGSWVGINDGLTRGTQPSIHWATTALAINPVDPKILYVGTLYSGVHQADVRELILFQEDFENGSTARWSLSKP